VRRLPTTLALFFIVLESCLAAESSVQTLNIEMRPLDAEVLFRKDRYDKSSFPVTVLTDEGQLPGRIEVKGSFTRRFVAYQIG
jgi:hypothetical protein